MPPTCNSSSMGLGRGKNNEKFDDDLPLKTNHNVNEPAKCHE